jgi:hypothetical protein
MPEPTIRESGEVAVEQTNELFRQADKPLVACLLSELDLEWCISAVRNMPEERQLPWDQIGAMLRDDNAFNFVLSCWMPVIDPQVHVSVNTARGMVY